jgi:rubrerythrin
MKMQQVEELILQSLEHERGGVKVYATALTCAVNRDLKEEWQKYHQQTKTHVTTLEQICRAFGIDPACETAGRAVVRHTGEGLVQAMKMALSAGDPAAAQLVACECVVLAETKDHLDWELLTKCAANLEGEAALALGAACEEIEDQEDEHLYHSRGWCRELWIESLGLHPFLPPPEEQKQVKTAIGAARAEQSAEKGR